MSVSGSGSSMSFEHCGEAGAVSSLSDGESQPGSAGKSIWPSPSLSVPSWQARIDDTAHGSLSTLSSSPVAWAVALTSRPPYSSPKAVQLVDDQTLSGEPAVALAVPRWMRLK